jgi:hypothetical protein
LNNDKIYSFLGTVVFHLLVLLILGFTVLRTFVPEEEEGILVNFGNVNIASGTFEPQYTESVLPQPTPPPVPLQPSVSREDIVTQDMEESVAVEEARKREERIETERRRSEE